MKTKKCKPVLISTENVHSQLELDEGKLSYELKQYVCKNPKQLILVSLDSNDEIKLGDWFINEQSNGNIALWQHNGNKPNSNPHKVIVFQNQIPKKYIKEFIINYNCGITIPIEIEMEEIYQPYFENNTFHKNPTKFTPKITNGFVTIIDNKSILYTEEEVWSFVYNSSEIILNWIVEKLQGKKTPQPNITEWFNKNKKQ